MTNNHLTTWLKQHSNIKTALLVAADINGVMRGKRLPLNNAADIKKIAAGTSVALSTPTVDIWGNEIIGCSQIVNTGDCNAIMRPTGRTPFCSSLLADTAIIPCEFYFDDNTPVTTCSRHVLRSILELFLKHQLTPVIALEVEFYLYDLNQSEFTPLKMPHTNDKLISREAYSIDDLVHFSPWLNEIRDTCLAAGIETTSMFSENSPAMFEINLNHCSDALQAADDMIFLRLIMRDIAQKHGYGLTYMPKPFAQLDGAGMHMHVSLLDKKGNNIFNNGTSDGTALLKHAVGGLLHTMDDLTLITAPHFSSYRRLLPNAYAPTTICWGYDNRFAPIRIPGGAPQATRIEHRLAGADVNPYLLISSVLASVLHGMNNTIPAPAPTQGNDNNHKNVIADMQSAIATFQASDFIKNWLPPLFFEAYLNCKKQEHAVFINQVTPLEIDTYRDKI